MREGSPPASVTCHGSHVMCRMSRVTCLMLLLLFIFWRDEDSWWTVRYQHTVHNIKAFVEIVTAQYNHGAKFNSPIETIYP